MPSFNTPNEPPVTPRPVGRGNPPEHSRFQPGTSGNPKGRPKGSQNYKKIIECVFNTKIKVKENGKTKTVTIKEAIILQLVKKALSDDHRAMTTAMSLMDIVDGKGGGLTFIIEG
jgi:hypothetical protein